ncbi:MAG: hypothetical protein IT211_15010 [Armatimonadetes bacterium]|nr:hypothetical protein [Armatimonadota bacterium]
MRNIFGIGAFLLLNIIFGISIHAQQSEWSLVDSIPGNRNLQIECADSLHCMAIAIYGFAYASLVRATTDGGKTWQTVHQDNDTPLSDALKYNTIAYPTPAVSLIACDSGIVLRTQDTGKTWERLYPGTPDNFFALTMRDANNGVMMTFPRAVWQTTNGGNSWDSVRIPFEKNISIEFIFQLKPSTLFSTLFFSRRDSATMISNDNGKTWQRYGYPTNVNSIIFLDSLTGWSCGSKATGGGFYNDFITHTTDGGKTWNVQLDSLIGEPFGLSDIAFADRKNGVAVGTGAKMLRTTDGGATWTFEATGLSQKRVESTFAGIAYPSRTRAFAVTTFGGIYRYMGEPPTSSAPIGYGWHSARGLQAKVYPNIVVGQQEIGIEFQVAHASRCNISLVTVLGKVVQRWGWEEIGAGLHRQKLKIGELSSGEYFLRVHSMQEEILLPIVVR